MLMDLIEALMSAATEKDKERAYRNLEKVGMDKATADAVVKELQNGK